MPTIKKKKFILRPFKRGDEDSVQKHVNDKDVSRFTLSIPHPYTKKDAKMFIDRVIKEQKSKNKLPVRFAIDVDGEVVGCIALNPTERDHKLTIGYWLGREYWGKGIMTEAVKAVTHYGLKTLKKKRICGYVFIKNEASARVLEKAGYVYEGTLHKESKKNGKYVDEYLFAKVQ